MSREIFVISDTHFGHPNIIGYCDRPFTDVEEMNEKIVENWNNTVRDGDIVYHLGDVFFSKGGGKILSRLRGRKRLVLGNHDNPLEAMTMAAFQKISVWRMFPEFGLLLTHVPIYSGAFVEEHSEERRGKYDVNVHGHLHNRVVETSEGVPDPRYRCVCVEHTNFTPMNIELLRTRF